MLSPSFQDESFVLADIIDVSNKIIQIRLDSKRKMDYFNDIFPLNCEILSLFNHLSLISKLKIKIALDAITIAIDNFNLCKERNFGIIIHRILMSWINLMLDKETTLGTIPSFYKKNIVKFLEADPVAKKDKIEELCKSTPMHERTDNIMMPCLQNSLIEQFDQKINKFATQIIKDVTKIKFRYKLECLRAIENNVLTFTRNNNWILLPINTKRRAYSQNRRLNNKFKICINSRIEDVNFIQVNSNATIKLRKILADGNVGDIDSISKATGFKKQTVISWFRNGYPKEYLDKVKFVAEQYQQIKPIYNSLDELDIESRGKRKSIVIDKSFKLFSSIDL